MSKSESQQQGGIYRQEALDHQINGQTEAGGALQLSSAWIKWAYRLLMIFSVVGLLFLCLGRMNEYAAGPAFIRAQHTTDITCPLSSTVIRVLVEPGQKVVEGETLVLLEDEDAADTVERYERELQAYVGEYLLHPQDDAVRRAITSVRSQLDYARQRLDARKLKAPHDGIVGDVRTRAGRQLLPGQSALTMYDEQDDLVLIAVIPGRYKPQLKMGQSARLEITGYPRAYQSVIITRIAREIVGPNEAYRSLGGEIADAVTISGPVLLVEALMEEKQFIADNRTYAYADGLQGSLQIKVRSIPIILNMLPGLRMLGKGD